MKKMFLILMMVFAVGCGAFAKPVTFEVGNYYVITDDENEQKDFSGMSDLDIVATVVSSIPDKTGEYKNQYISLDISEANDLVKKYGNFFAYSKDQTHFIAFQNLGDGRQLTIFYCLVSECTK